MTPLQPAGTAPAVEKKVTWSTVWTYLIGVAGLAVLNGVADTNLISALPDVFEVLVAPVVPAAIGLVAGFITKHSPRPDLPADQR